MPKPDPTLMKQLRNALRNRDMEGMRLVCLQMPSAEVGAAAAHRILMNEMPADVRDWWLHDACDLPDDPASLLREAFDTAMLHILDPDTDSSRGNSDN